MKKTKPVVFDLTITKLATKTGLSVSYLSRIKNGTRIPRIHLFKKIADALDLTMDSLYSKLKHFYKEKK